jgi:hypothetical protein
MTPERQGQVLEPLRAVADAAARAGRSTQADVCTQVEMAPDYRSVNVYLTDPDRRAAFLDAVREVDPEADTQLLNVRRSAKSRQQLRREMTALVTRRDLPFTIEVATSTVDGSAIELGVEDPKAAQEYLARPAVAQQLGDVVLTGGGSRVGPVGAKLADIDSAFIDTRTSRYTWDGLDAQGYTRRLNGVRNAAVGDFVCQLGYGSKVVCNIRTTHSGDAAWVTQGTPVFGSVGVPHSGGAVARTGDSGGPVITINDPNSRQLNGMVVAGFGCTIIGGEKVCSVQVGWIEVLDVFDRFSLTLVP